MSYEKLNLSNGGKFSAEHVSHIEDGIIQNALDLKTKQDKGDYLTPESTIPSEKIVEDETHRFATDSEKASWNSKANGAHEHTLSDIEGLQTALDGKAESNHSHDENYYSKTSVDELLSGKAEKVHGHVVSDVDGLQSALDGKSDVGHEHSIDGIVGLQTALDGKSGINHNHDGTYSPVGHTHASVDITDLESFVDGRIGVVAGSALDEINGEIV